MTTSYPATRGASQEARAGFLCFPARTVSKALPSDRRTLALLTRQASVQTPGLAA